MVKAVSESYGAELIDVLTGFKFIGEQIKLLEDALTGYRLDLGSYPTGDAGLQSLVENADNNEKWNGPYIKPSVPKDPWGNEYVYTCPGEHGDYDLVSYGADGQPGGEGDNADITNWE